MGPLLGTSLPIKITLSDPVSQPLIIRYNTFAPAQGGLVVFEPEELRFESGELEKTLTYTTFEGAKSGKIRFEVIGTYKNIYEMPYDTCQMELYDYDSEMPTIINY